MQKISILLLAAAMSLSGCAPMSFQTFGDPLPQPRPAADHDSEASKILYEKMPQFRDVRHPKLAVDTTVWKDEASVKRGFDYDYIYRMVYKPLDHRQITEGIKKVQSAYGSLPIPLREEGSSSVLIHRAAGGGSTGTSMGSAVFDSTFDAFAFSGSVGNISATQPGSAGLSKFGIAVGLAEFFLSAAVDAPKNGNSDELYGERGLAIVLSVDERKKFKAAVATKSWKHREYIGQVLIQHAAKILAEKGFKAVGPYWYKKDYDVYIFQTLSNPSIGCPEPDPDAKPGTVYPNDFCRLEFFIGPKTMFFEEIGGRLTVGVMGGDRRISVDNGFGAPLKVFGKNQPEDLKESINEYLFAELSRQPPNIMVYVPSRKNEKGVLEPQYVLDKNGRHYFMVTMPRALNAGATASPKVSTSGK